MMKLLETKRLMTSYKSLSLDSVKVVPSSISAVATKNLVDNITKFTQRKSAKFTQPQFNRKFL